MGQAGRHGAETHVLRVGVICAQIWKLLPVEHGKMCGMLGWLLEALSSGNLCFSHRADMRDEEWFMQWLYLFFVPLTTPCLVCQDTLCDTLHVFGNFCNLRPVWRIRAVSNLAQEAVVIRVPAPVMP